MSGDRLLGIPEPLTDARFDFDGGWWLAVHADSDLDPWSLRAPGDVLVGRAHR